MTIEKENHSNFMTRRALIGAFVCPGSVQAATRLTKPEIEDAIALGKNYRSAKKLWKQEFEGSNKLRMSGYWSWSGSKYLNVITDRVAIAMSAADAAHEMREITVKEVERLGGLGTLRVIVVISAVGADNIARIQDRFAAGKTHMVLELEGKVIQPQQKVELAVNYTPGLQVWSVAQAGNMVFATNTGAFDSGGVVYEFVYPLPWVSLPKGGRFVLLGEDGKRHDAEIDFSRLR